ncbi:Cof-type HAD-IIB family hydrolase [Cryobacterium zhongshanensis]|uniref:Cof-type HAD-IIB family hydrolase n=1 Tax=Cryobacterium zhongshanensis TaxID=2928153 RepID=UPI003558E8D6
MERVTHLQEPADIRLIVSDMDGTLLDDSGRVPDDFWPVLESLLRAGVMFSPASGRQYQTLRETFGERAGLVFIAENGTNVVRDGVSIALEPVVLSVIPAIVEWVRTAVATGSDVGIVVCGVRTAYIERTDAEFFAKVKPYYDALATVDDVLTASSDDEVVKLAIYDFASAEQHTGPALRGLGLEADVVVSGEHWVDVMRPGVNKGKALIRLQNELGISREQTMAFGDYLNDAEMLDAAGESYAMANAHPSIRARARHLAPSNDDDGVVTSILAAFPGLLLDAR